MNFSEFEKSHTVAAGQTASEKCIRNTKYTKYGSQTQLQPLLYRILNIALGAEIFNKFQFFKIFNVMSN